MKGQTWAETLRHRDGRMEKAGRHAGDMLRGLVKNKEAQDSEF